MHSEVDPKSPDDPIKVRPIVFLPILKLRTISSLHPDSKLIYLSNSDH